MMPFSLLLFSCASAPTTDPAPMTWQGWVYDDIPAENTPGLEIGNISMTNLESGVVIEAEQRDDQRLGLWTFEVEGNADVSIRIEGPEQFPTVWKARTPNATGFWYAGAIFGVKTATFEAFLESLAELTQQEIGQTDAVQLYGEPLPLTTNDLDAWTDAQITVYDGAGQVHEAITLILDEETGGLMLSGTEPQPIAAFTATDLAPGNIALVIDASDGRSTVVEYEAEAGDLLSAFAFTLPLEAP